MMNHLFIEQLSAVNPLTDLPGFNAQKELAPPYRENVDLELIKKYNPKLSAVLILLYEDEFGALNFPITLRNYYDGPHANEYSLPGGRHEPEDLTYDYTAIRETTEELGLLEDNIEILTPLTELYIPPSEFLVYPFVGIHHGSPNFLPDTDEVQLVVPIDLEAFMLAEPCTADVQKNNQTKQVPAYQIGDNDYIWGATAMILQEFKRLLQKL